MSQGSPSAVTHAGLSAATAAERQRSEGFNELPRAKRRTPLRIVAEVLREPMLALLLAGGLVYLLLGNGQEAIILLIFASLSVLITVVQESRTERVLEALRDLTSPQAMVFRDGELQRIVGREVVRGDLIVLTEGDRVPADARLIEAHDLQCDESLLTGESVPVRKRIANPSDGTGATKPGGDDLPILFGGALIVRGRGVAEVTAIGALSEIGRIGQSLNTLEAEPPRLQAQTRQLVRVFALVGLGVSILAVLLYGTLRGSWLDALLAGIALGMSMLPEEFPMVLTVFMAMGAWRISRARVLTRRASAIETLGAATVLCTDKTGTLTENRMTVVELRLPAGAVFRPQPKGLTSIPTAFQALARCGRLASAPQPFDPMDRAFHSLAASTGSGRLVKAYGLRPDLLAMTNVWDLQDADGKLTVAAKGAPESIAELCRLDAAARRTLLVAINQMAASGLRVLGIAQASAKPHTLGESQQDFQFTLLGLAGLADPLRNSVPQAVEDCRSAGIRVMMITGDYPVTASAIARQAGIAADSILTGEELAALSDAELAVRVRRTTVFARTMPEQKLRIVQALKANGEIVAMTGDGVNDAPSLKAAHIGIAMGSRGTDVAREAAALVLLDDDFGSIARAIRLGRRIYDNLRKAIGFIFAVHVPIAGLALLPLLLGMPLLFGPVHIAFLEMVIDPVCSLVFEAESGEKDIMRRRPRAADEPLIPRSLIGWNLFQGITAFAICAGVFIVGGELGMPETELRALTFLTLILAIVSLIFVDRSFGAALAGGAHRPSAALLAVLLIVALSLAVALFWPPAMTLFRFGTLHRDDIAIAIACALALLAILEFAKFLRMKPQVNVPAADESREYGNR